MRFLSNCIVVQAHTRMIQRRDRQHHSYRMRGTLGGGTMTRGTNTAPLSRPEDPSGSQFWLIE